jgi:hypothetical protein
MVGQLLKAEGYSLQGNAKVIEGNQSPDRDELRVRTACTTSEQTKDG